MQESTFVLLKIDAAAARQWLAGLVAGNQINDATAKPGDVANNPQAALTALIPDTEVAPQRELLLLHTRISTSDIFNWQDALSRQRFTKLPDFVTVRGGAYFFMPGLDAVRFLARQTDALPAVSKDVLP